MVKRHPFIFTGISLLIGLALWSLWLEPQRLTQKHYPLHLPQWPTACHSLSVALLADIHTGSPFNGIDKLRDIVAATNQAAPDIILLAGDFVIHGVVGGDFVDPVDIANELTHLQAPLGVYAVLGNHDWWLGPERVATALTHAGITLLEDAATPITQDQCHFWLAGISDYWEGPHNIPQALAPIPEASPIIAFTHNPDVFTEVPPRVALTFAGHTHGGQVYIPFIGRPIVPSDHGERFAIGHIIEGDQHLYVNPGLGTSILPIRFLVPPEITLIRLMSSIPQQP